MAGAVSDPRYQELIGWLRARRLSLSMSQTQLGRMLGKPQQFVAKFESLERRLDVVEFIDVARALKLDNDDSLRRTLDEIPPAGPRPTPTV